MPFLAQLTKGKKFLSSTQKETRKKHARREIYININIYIDIV
jgi:hypothetical protein